MRITFSQILILLLMTVLSYAEPSSAQEVLNKKINLSVENKTLKEVLKTLAKTNQVQFVYNQEVVQTKEKISVQVSNQELKEVLDNLLSKYNISYQVIKNKVILTNLVKTESLSDNSTVQAVKITGKVTDETNQPLIGVSVRVKGTTTGTQTDLDGNYSITVPDDNVVLVFTYVGFIAQEVVVSGRSNINVQMKANENSLNEVVVVGYGTQKRANITGSVASANLEDFRNSPTTNIANRLQGTVPGLNVGQVNRAGATPSISIRGQNTLSGNQSVLIILDGVQYNGSLSSINPDDIASIDVLKDASSTAVYGAQAANGVILISSRKGTKDQKPRISFSSSYATQSPNNNLRPLNRQEYIDHVRDLYYNEAYLAPAYMQSNPAFNIVNRVDPSMRDASGNLLPNDFNWYKEATHTGYIVDNQLSVSGGSDKFNYLLSGNATTNSGFIKNDLFKRKGLRANLETQATSWLKLGLQTFGTFVNEDGVEPNIATIIQQSPLILPYDANGNLVPYPFNTNFSSPFLGYTADDYDRHNYFFANVYSEISVPYIKGLTYRINFGQNYRLDLHNTSSIYDAGLTGQASKEVTTYYDYTFDNILTYNRSFKKHDITATLLYGSIQRKNDYTRAYSNAFSRLTLGYNSLQQGTNRFAISNAWKEALEYQMVRVNYGYDSRYLITATIRRDGFSGFAQNNKYGIFPSVGLGWVATNESFFKPSWLNYLKVRASYGEIGNQTNRYSSLSTLGSGASYVFGDGGSTLFGQQVNSLPNPDLRWERTSGTNAGLDFTLFKGILTGVFEYYNTKTTDLLFNVNIPTTTGFNTISTNVGQINNQGAELSLTSKNFDTKNFKWNTTLNFSRNVNKVVKLLGDRNGDGKEDDLPQSNLFIGQPINAIYNWQANGIWQVGDNILAGYSPGTYRIVDQNQDGVIDASDRAILGKTDPAYRISMLNSFQYKGFSLTVFLNSIQGGKNSYLGGNSPTLIRDDNTIRYNYLSAIDYWSPTNPNGKYARSIIASTVSPPLYQDRSFIRLQDVSLSYRFTGKFIEKLKIQNLNVYLSGRNLATWTKWEGWDPETNQGLTNDGRPVLRGYAAGINVTF